MQPFWSVALTVYRSFPIYEVTCKCVVVRYESKGNGHCILETCQITVMAAHSTAYT